MATSYVPVLRELELDSAPPPLRPAPFVNLPSPETGHYASPACGETVPLPPTPTRPNDQTSITWLSEDKIIELACAIGMVSLALGWHLSNPRSSKQIPYEQLLI